MLSGCLFIPIPIGTVYSPATAYQKPEGSVTSREEAMTAPPTPSDGKLAAKKENQESAKKRVECKGQAEKLLSDADRRAHMKECMSKER